MATGNEAATLKALVEQKENEWKDITYKRLQVLEKACDEKDEQLATLKDRYVKLKDDFKYNLKLLQDRDIELQRYDKQFTDVKANLNVRTGEVSEMKIVIDNLHVELDQRQKSQTELQQHYQQRIKQKQAENDEFRSAKENVLHHERREYERIKHRLESRVTDLEQEMDQQQRELTSGFDEAMKRREHEFRIKLDELNNMVLAHELKAKLLSKELEVCKSLEDQHAEATEKLETNHYSLEKQLKDKDWQLLDVTAMKDARISDLESRLKQSEAAMKRAQEDFQRRYNDMDKFAREKESALSKSKESHAEHEQIALGQLVSIQSKLEETETQMRQLSWEKRDTDRDNELLIQRLQSDVADKEHRLEELGLELAEYQAGTTSEVEALREQVDKLKNDIAERKLDINRYKKQLSLSADREAALERSKAQVELDWQRRYEEIERTQYQKSEQFIDRLTEARDQAVASVKEKDRELEQKGSLIAALQRDQQLAFTTLKEHGITVNKNLYMLQDKNLMAVTGDLEEIREQNASLRSVIKEMRAQMEQLTGPSSGHGAKDDPGILGGESHTTAHDYVKALEDEVRNLKRKYRELEQNVHRTINNQKHSTRIEQEAASNAVELHDNPAIQTHIRSLNDAIGSLRSEKVEFSAQVKKQQARILHLEASVDQISKEPRQKQVEIDQIQYELSSQGRRHQAEAASLRQRISELELQLAESRKEADEYHRANLEKNVEITAMGNEVSNLKLNMAARTPTISYGAQELMIQQLHDEISNLKQRRAYPAVQTVTNERGVTADTSLVSELQTKLQAAVKYITQLAREKQQLIELGNRHRAELLKTGLQPPVTPPRNNSKQTVSNPWPQASQQLSITDRLQSKLSHLEQLQYQLTKQELQYAQHISPKGVRRVAINGAYTESPEPDDSSTVQGNSMQGVASANTTDELRTSSQQDDSSFRQLPIPIDPQLLQSLSSAGGESLQEVWRMLEAERPSPSLIMPRHLAADRKPSGDSHPHASTNSIEWQVSGQPAGATTKPVLKASAQSASVVTRPSEKKHKAMAKPKIRNYNLKDERTAQR